MQRRESFGTPFWSVPLWPTASVMQSPQTFGFKGPENLMIKESRTGKFSFFAT